MKRQDSEVQNIVQFLERALKGSKPGLKAQLKMVVNPRPGDKTYQEVEETCIKAGVLALLYPFKKKIYLVLTKRTATVPFHQGQISLPGGRQHQGESIIQTALRESKEELNIESHKIKILGELTPLYVPPSNYCIYPVVAATWKRPRFDPSGYEVAEIIEIPLSHLLNPQSVTREVWTLGRNKVDVPFYLYKSHKIWGATAMVLAELIEILKSYI